MQCSPIERSVNAELQRSGSSLYTVTWKQHPSV